MTLHRSMLLGRKIPPARKTYDKYTVRPGYVELRRRHVSVSLDGSVSDDDGFLWFDATVLDENGEGVENFGRKICIPVDESVDEQKGFLLTAMEILYPLLKHDEYDSMDVNHIVNTVLSDVVAATSSCAATA